MDKQKLYDYCMNSPENTNPAVIASIVEDGSSGENNVITLNCTRTDETYIHHGKYSDRSFDIYALPEGYAFGEPIRGNTNTIFLQPFVNKNDPIYILNAVFYDHYAQEEEPILFCPTIKPFDLYYYDDIIWTGWVGTCKINNQGLIYGACFVDDRTKFIICGA